MEERITLKLRAQQLADIIDALVLAEEALREDAETISSMERVDTQTVAELEEQKYRYRKLYLWMQHVMEEAEL